jgi:hypothetical protein
MKKILISLLLLVIAYAGDKSNVGVAGAHELRITADPVALALGRTNMSYVGGINAILLNPAGISFMNNNYEFNVSSMNYLFDTKFNEFGLAMKLGETSAVAFGVRTFDLGEIEQTTNLSPNGNGVIFNPQFNVFSLSYSQKFSSTVRWGVTGSLVNENIMNTSANAVAITTGIQYTDPEGVSFSMVLRNVGSSLSWSGTDNEYKVNSKNETRTQTSYENTDLPAAFDMSLGYKLNLNEDNNISILGLYKNEVQALDVFTAAIEYNFENQFFFRGSLEQQSESDFSAFKGLGLGFGVNYDLSETSKISFNYAYKGVEKTEFFDPINSVGFNLSF